MDIINHGRKRGTRARRGLNQREAVKPSEDGSPMHIPARAAVSISVRRTTADSPRRPTVTRARRGLNQREAERAFAFLQDRDARARRGLNQREAEDVEIGYELARIPPRAPRSQSA